MKAQHAGKRFHLLVILGYASLFCVNCFGKKTAKLYMDEYLNSIDDKFLTCKKQMYKHIIFNNLLQTELKSDKNFKKAWTEAKKYLSKKKIITWSNTLEKDPKSLRKIALCAYTTQHIYSKLSAAMRKGRKNYVKNFKLISLHFLVTDAIQRLNPQQKCQTTYRRTKVNINIKGMFVRFGSFASTSRSASKKEFGKKTCFIIKTCHGARISSVSVYSGEDEVLIPPYEWFKIAKAKQIPVKLHDCGRVYRLDSVGTKSKMNCEYVNQKKEKKSAG